YVECLFVTTPHACKAGASGMTRVCRPTPVVRFNHMSEPSLLKQLMYWLARADVGRLCFYPRELTLEPTNTIGLSVCTRTTRPFFSVQAKVEMLLAPTARLSFSCVHAGPRGAKW